MKREPSPKREPSSEAFAEFYAAYLEEHRNPVNRALHLFAKTAALGALAAALALRSPTGRIAALIAAPLLLVAPCWLGHLLFERNRPTSRTRPSSSLLGSLTLSLSSGARGSGRPWFSLLADLRMCLGMLGS